MVEPGASSQEIRKEIYGDFSSRLQLEGIDEEVVECIEDAVMAEDPPYEFSKDLLELI